MKPLLVLSLALAGCAVDLGVESFSPPPSAQARERCARRPPAGVDQGAPFALAFPEGGYFIYGETIVGRDPALTFLHNTGAVGGDPCLEEPVRARDGGLATLIDLTPEEIAADAARGDGRHTALWPLSGFVAGGTGVVFYQEVLLRTYFDFAVVGTGVARLRYGEVAERARPARDPAAPLLTWLSPRADWGTGALLAADGYAYVYGCYQRSQWDHACRVARVAPDDAADPDAYRYFAGEDAGWVERVEQAAVVIQGPRHLSGAFVPALAAYVFVYSGFLENQVYWVTAPTPAGPFSAPRLLFEAVAPAELFIGDVDLLAAYGEGRRLLVSYHTSPKDGGSSVRFVDVVLP